MKASIFLTIALLILVNVLQPKKYLIEVADKEMSSSKEVKHDDDNAVTEEGKKTDLQFDNKIYL